MAYQDILYDVDDRVATITLNRPDRMNALGLTLRGELVDAFAAANKDPEVRVVVLTGAGGNAFSAGYDIKETADNANKSLDEWRDILEAEYEFALAPWECSKPVIAMIEGHSLAGALEVAQMCDIRYCSDDSSFGAVETRFSNGILTLIMPWILGARSRELIYTGDTIGAEEALRLGFVNRVFPKAALQAETMKIAKRMSRVALAAVQWNKRAINQTFEAMGFTSAMRYGREACIMLDATDTPEYRAFNRIRTTEGLGPALKHLRDTFGPYE